MNRIIQAMLAAALLAALAGPARAEPKLLDAFKDTGRSVAFSPDGKTLAMGGDKEIKLWDVASAKVVSTLKIDKAHILAFSPDGKTLASANGAPLYGDRLKWTDLASGRVVELTHTVEQLNSVAFSPDGKTLAAGGIKDQHIRLWDMAGGKKVVEWETPGGVNVCALAFSPDGKTLASTSLDKTVLLWDVDNGKIVATLEGHKDSVFFVAFSPDGKTLASASADKTIKLWDVAGRKNTATLDGHENYVNFVTFSPDGKTLASGSGRDRTIRLWDVASGKNTATLTDNENVISLAFSPDGKLLAAGHWPGALNVWDLSADK